MKKIYLLKTKQTSYTEHNILINEKLELLYFWMCETELNLVAYDIIIIGKTETDFLFIKAKIK